jgi:hypothetical protein
MNGPRISQMDTDKKRPRRAVFLVYLNSDRVISEICGLLGRQWSVALID